MTSRGVRVVRLAPEHRAAFLRVTEQCSEDSRSCRCTAYWTPDWETAGGAFRDAMFARGESDGYLLFDGDEPAGWCQCAPLSRGLRLRVPEPRGPDDWAATCLLIRPAWRGRGLCLRLLELMIDDLPRRGCARLFVVGHRPAAYDDPDSFLELPAAVCERAGLALARDDEVCPLFVREFRAGTGEGQERPAIS